MKSTRVKLLFILFIFAFLVSTMGLISCDKVYDIEEVELTSTPAFVENGIELGDSLDFTGVGLAVTYSNGVVEYVDVTQSATISGFRKDVAGEQVITIIYTNGTVQKEVSVTVNVKRPAVKSIDVVSTKDNTSYVKGNAFNYTGLSAIVTYDKLDSNDKPYTETFTLSADNVANQTGRDYTYSPDVVGEQTMRFLLYADVYATLKIEVSDHLVTGVAMYAPPTKTSYAEGAQLDLSGAQVRLYMNDSVTEQTYTVVSDGLGGWTLDGFHGIITAKDNLGNDFSSANIGTYNLHFYYQEDADSPAYKTGTSVALSVVERDVKSNGVTFSSALPRQIQNNVNGLNFSGVTMTVAFNDQTTASYDMTVFYDDQRGVYESKGKEFYIAGYDITRAVAQNVTIHFYKPETLADGSIQYTTEEYPSYYTTEIITLEESVSAITITDNSTQDLEYTRYIDVTNPTQYSFVGYVGDVIPIDQYAFTLIYNSGKEAPATLDSFDIQAPAVYFSLVNNQYKLASAGTTALVLNYSGIQTRTINVTIKSPEFDPSNQDRLVFTPPSKLEYEQGSDEQLDLTGAVAEIYLQDRDTRQAVQKLTLTGAELLPYVDANQLDLSIAGNQTITIDYFDAVREFTVNVKSQVSSIAIAPDSVTEFSFVKGTTLNGATDFSGLAIEVEYADASTDSELKTDFSDASWMFTIEGDAIETYPLESGYVATYDVSVYYMGVLCDTTIKITVHNYITAITLQSADYTVIVGKEIDTAQYTVTATYQDGTTTDLPLSSSIFSHDYNYNLSSVGTQEVTISVADEATGGSSVTTTQEWTIAAATMVGYQLTVAPNVTLPTVTIEAPISADSFVLTRYYDNDTFDTPAFTFEHVGEHVDVGYHDVYVCVGGERVDFTFVTPDQDKYQYVAATEGGNSYIKVKVVFDVVTAVSLVGATQPPTVTVKQGFYFNAEGQLLSTAPSDMGIDADILSNYWQQALTTINGWTISVTYQNTSTQQKAVSDGGFRVEGFATSDIGKQLVKLVYNDDEAISIEFAVDVVARELLSVSLPSSMPNIEITEGTPITNKLLRDDYDVYLVAVYDNGAKENVSVFANMVMADDGSDGYYNQEDRMTAGTGSISRILSVAYQGRVNNIDITVLEKEIVNIQIDDSLAPKNTYYEREYLSTINVGGVDYLTTADNVVVARLLFVYNNGDTAFASDIATSMIVTDDGVTIEQFISQFNRTDLTAATAIQVTLAYPSAAEATYTTSFNIWLYDRLTPTIDKAEYDGNEFIYYYGAQPVIEHTLVYTNTSGTDTPITSGVNIKFISQANVEYHPVYENGIVVRYIVGDGAQTIEYLPVGAYTVSITYDGRDHESSDVPGLNKYVNNDKVLTIIKTPLVTAFDTDGTKITLGADGKYQFDDVYGEDAYNGTYNGQYFADLVTYAHLHHQDYTYKPNFVYGDKDDIITKITLQDSVGNVIDGAITQAGSYMVIVELMDKDNSTFLSNYQVTTVNLMVTITQRKVYVEFYNSTVAEGEDRNTIVVTYGDSAIELNDKFYKVWAVDALGNKTNEKGLIGDDVLYGTLGKNSNGYASIGSDIERRDYEVGYYGIGIPSNSLYHPNYQLVISAEEEGSPYFSEVYYVINPAPVDITIDDQKSTYGTDGIVEKNGEQVGTISIEEQMFSVDGKLYAYQGSTVYEDVAVGTIDTDNNTFVINGVTYKYNNSTILKGEVPQVNSYIQVENRIIYVERTHYFYIEENGTKNIYQNRGTIALDAHTITLDGISYNYQLKQDVEWSITVSSRDQVYNASYNVAFVDGKFIDTATGLGIEFDLTFSLGDVVYSNGNRPIDVAEYAINGDQTTATTTSYNYAIATITSGVYTIEEKEILVIPIAETKVYNGEITTPAFEYVLKFAEIRDLKGIGTITGSISREMQGVIAGEDVGAYRYTQGSLANANYIFNIQEEYYTIVERDLYMAFEEGAITREYNGLTPDESGVDFSNPSYRLYYMDNGNQVDWTKAVSASTLSMSYAQSAPGYGRYPMTLTETNSNLNIVLDKEYNYTINKKKIDVTFAARLEKLDDLASNWLAITNSTELEYAYDNPRIIKAIPVSADVVAGDSIDIGIDVDIANNVGSYTVTALTIMGNTNYEFRETRPSITFSIVPKNIYVYLSSDSLTMTYNGNSAKIRIEDVELYKHYVSYDDKYALEDENPTENSQLSSALSLVLSGSNTSTWRANGYDVKVSLSAPYSQNYTLNTVSNREYLPTSFNGEEYIEGYGGSKGSTLVYMIKKQHAEVAIATDYLEKYFDDANPAVSQVSVQYNNIASQVKDALTYTRLTTPYGTEVTETDKNAYNQKDVGTFRIGINNSGNTTGEVANYYFTLASNDYVYTIHQRQVTIEMSQGTATNIYRRYNGLPLTTDDIVTDVAIDGVTRTISMSNYRPASVTDTADIIRATGLKFVFVDMLATEVGTYQFYPVSTDYNHYFTIKGEDQEGYSYFEIRRCTLDIAISNNMYRYYQDVNNYYDDVNGTVSEIDFATAYKINTQVYIRSEITKAITATATNGKLTIDGTEYYAVGNMLFSTTPIAGIVAEKTNMGKVYVGEVEYTLNDLEEVAGLTDGAVLKQGNNRFYINNNDKTIHQYAGSIEGSNATLIEYTLTQLQPKDFETQGGTALLLNTSLATNDSARTYTGKIFFNIADTFEEEHANYSLPGLSSKVITIKPAIIPVTIDDTDENGDELTKQYGNYISDIEKYLLKEGKIYYNLDEFPGVSYSGSIDSSKSLIEIYSTRYYYLDGNVFLIVGDLAVTNGNGNLTVSGTGYIVENNAIYRIYGNYSEDGAFTISNRTYYIDGEAIYSGRGGNSTSGYFYADRVGDYDVSTDIIKLYSSIETLYRRVGNDVVLHSSVGEVISSLSSVNIEGTRYSYTADGYMYKTAGTIDESVSVITIGNDEYIYVGAKVFNVVGHYDNNQFTIEKRTYAIDNIGNMYLANESNDGRIYADRNYFTISDSSYQYDANNYVYNVLGNLVDDNQDGTFDYFDLKVTGSATGRYYFYAGDRLLYNAEGVPYSNDESKYSIDQASKAILVNGISYTYTTYTANGTTYGYIRSVAGNMSGSTLTIGDTLYTVAQGDVFDQDGNTVGRYNNNLATIFEATYYVDGDKVYSVLGSVNDDSTITVNDDRYVLVTDFLMSYKGKFDATTRKVTLGDLSYKISNRYVFYDTELAIGSYENNVLTLADTAYYVIGNMVYVDGNLGGSINTSESEFSIGNTKYIFDNAIFEASATKTETIAYNTSQVTFEYYTMNMVDGKPVYTKVNMSNAQGVGTYYFRVNFGGLIENQVDGRVESGNYTLIASDYGQIEITQAPITVTLSGTLDWTYRQAYTDNGDLARDNLASIMKFDCNMDMGFDLSSIKYPELTQYAKDVLNSLSNVDTVGTTYTVENSALTTWFTGLDTINPNYKFIINGSATIRVVARELKTSVVSMHLENSGNYITRSVATDYGTLPQASGLAVLYTGFSATEFSQEQSNVVFDTAIYHAAGAADAKWYIVYNYSQTAARNDIVKATQEQIAILESIITTNAQLPNFYQSIDADGWIDLYDVGATNRIKVAEGDDSDFVSDNYAVLAVDNFTYEVKPVKLTLTLKPGTSGAELTKLYGEQPIRRTDLATYDYEIIFTNASGQEIAVDEPILMVNVNGTMYKADAPQVVFFDTKAANYNWLVYDEKVNMNNDGNPIGSAVYLSLGDSTNSKFEGITANYTLEYAYYNNINMVIKIYNKIESMAVGDGALYSAVTSANSYIPITITYRDGTKVKTQYYLNGSNPANLTMGDGNGNFVYVNNDSLGNQIVKISYSETNLGVVGGTDSASVYITLRAYETADVSTQNSISSDEYRKFAYHTYMSTDQLQGLDITKQDGVIGVDSDGDGDADIFFYMVAIASGSFVLNGTEYSYSNGIVYNNGAEVGNININDRSMTVDNDTYYYGCETNVIRIYNNKIGDTLSGVIIGSEFRLTKYVYAVNTKLSSTVYTYPINSDIADTEAFNTAEDIPAYNSADLAFDYIEFIPSTSNNVEIRLTKHQQLPLQYVTFATSNQETLFDTSQAGVVGLDVDGDSVYEYYLAMISQTIGTTEVRYVYLYQQGDPTNQYAIFALDEEVTNWKSGSVYYLSNLILSITGNTLDVKTELVGIDKGDASVSQDGYVFGTTRTVDDGYTHAYTVDTRGEFDKLQIEFSLKPIYGETGEFNFVVFSYRDSVTKVMYELSLRMISGAEHRGKLYLVESVDGRERITEYNTYRSLATTVMGTYYDLLDGKTHHIDVYLNRLSCVLTVVINNSLKISHSLLSESGIIVDGEVITTEVSFPLEDYREYYDNDNAFSTNRVLSTAYFTVKNLTFSVSSMAYVTMGYYNEMAVILTPSDSAETVLYVTDSDPLKVITIGEYFEIFGNYYQDTIMRYYLNGVQIEYSARRIWLEEGVYTLTAQILYYDKVRAEYVVLSEADFHLTVAIEDQEEKIDDKEISYTNPVVLEATTETTYQGNTNKHYNYYRAEFNLDGIAGVTYDDDSIYNMIINIRANSDGSAFSPDSPQFIGLSLGVRFATSTTELLLRVKDNTYIETTTAINWLNGEAGTYTVEAYMDDNSHIITVNIYRGATKLHTMTIKRDSLLYSTNNIFIESESSDAKYTQKSRDIDAFINGTGSQSMVLTNARVIMFTLALNTDCDIRQSLYSITAAGESTGAQEPNTGEVYNSSINPTTTMVGSGQHAAIMLGRGDNVPYGMDYNTYTTEFSLKREAGGAAQVRFIIAENMPTSIASMYNAYKENDNFTSTRSIALVYEDDGSVASMYFTFMVSGMTRVYRQYVYRNVPNGDPRVLSYGEGEAETKHSISVNIFKSPESITNEDLFTASNVTVMSIQVVIDGNVVAENGVKKNYYFPYYNTVAFWKDYPNKGAMSADSVNLNDKYFINQYTMAGVVFSNCTLSLYNMQVAKGDTLNVTDQYILDEVKGGDENATNYYYFDYFKDLYGLGGAYTKRTYTA